MSLISELQCILDLKEPQGEAEKKFAKTYMLVNGEIVYVAGFNWNEQCLLTSTPNGGVLSYEVDSLEVFLPETGIYLLNIKKDVIPVFIQKIPKRQWLKSFSNSFYRMTHLSNGTEIKVNNVVYLDLVKGRIPIYVDRNQDIWHSYLRVGYIKNSTTLVCTNKLFEQELKDWWKHG